MLRSRLRRRRAVRYRPADRGAGPPERSTPARSSGSFRSTVSGAGFTEAARAALDAAADRLDPLSGSMIQSSGSPRPSGGRLLLVAHHLVVDGVSWRILVPDLAAACSAGGRRAPIRPATGGTSLRTWAHGLRGGRRRLGRAASSTCGGPHRPPTGGARRADAGSVRRRRRDRRPRRGGIAGRRHRARSDHVPDAYHGIVDDGLLTALAAGAGRWRREPRPRRRHGHRRLSRATAGRSRWCPAPTCPGPSAGSRRSSRSGSTSPASTSTRRSRRRGHRRGDEGGQGAAAGDPRSRHRVRHAPLPGRRDRPVLARVVCPDSASTTWAGSTRYAPIAAPEPGFRSGFRPRAPSRRTCRSCSPRRQRRPLSGPDGPRLAATWASRGVSCIGRGGGLAHLWAAPLRARAHARHPGRADRPRPTWIWWNWDHRRSTVSNSGTRAWPTCGRSRRCSAACCFTPNWPRSPRTRTWCS